MAEQNSKGIALVILGIVAIIAIVGLVLLFTGAKKSTGEFVVPVAKEYGGAIKGVASPYDRAFIGRAYQYESGMDPELSGRGSNPGTRAGAWTSYGEDEATIGTTAQSYAITEKRQQQMIPSEGLGKACEGAVATARTLYPKYPDLKSVEGFTSFQSDKRVRSVYTKEGVRYGVGSLGEECMAASDMGSFIEAKSRGATSMGSTYELVNTGRPGWCCKETGLRGEGGAPYYS